MARRTQTYTKIPWTGGVNTSVDAGVLPDNDLIQADNIVFSSASSRRKREGISYFDTDIPASIRRSSSGTTRTIVFTSGVILSGPTDQILVSGESITVTGAGNSAYNCVGGTISSVATTLVANDTITYTFSGATNLTETSTNDTGIVVTKTSAVLGCLDFWYYDSANQAKARTVIAVTSQPKIFKYDQNGCRTELTAAGGATALTGPITACDLRSFNNQLLMTFSGVGNTPKTWNPNGGTTTWSDLSGSPPDANYMQEHLGRIWMDDKTNLDLLHYCATFDETQWQGAGDSGALPLSVGDGDPIGISAIFPPFKDTLIVTKGTKARKIAGYTPEDFQVLPMSEGLGSISHKAVAAIDLDDVFYMTQRGFHSVVATDTKGDFEGNFLSAKIQPTFISDFQQTRFKYTQSAYIPSLNSVCYTITPSNQTEHYDLWFYNVQFNEWYRWPNVYAQSVCPWLDAANKVRLMFGDRYGRLCVAQNGDYSDFSGSSYLYQIKTGAIYPDGNLQTLKRFNKLSLLFRPKGNYNFTVYFRVDDFPAQALVFGQSEGGAALGTEFVLGTSELGNNGVLAPFTKDIEGFGRGCSIEVFQASADGQVDIYGFIIEYEVADIADEVNSSNTGA